MSTRPHTGCMNLLLDELEVAILIVGRDDGIIRYINHRVCKDTGKSYKAIHGQHYRQLFWPEFISVYDHLLTECEDGKEHTKIYYWAEMAVWEQISARNIVWESAPCLLMSITYITEIARSEYKFENMAYFDNLLKLPNGAKLEEDINDIANVETVGLIYIEIERFDEINNLYGWDNGDNLLKQVRDWLLSSESRRGQLYRVNNGFALLGRKVSMDEAKDRSEEILHRFQQPWALSAGGNNLMLYCTIRLGIVYGKYVKNEMRNLLLRTIRAQEKTAAGYAVYDEEADRKARQSLLRRDTFINCIFNNMKGFSVNYQPIVETATGQWVALEALCRWQMPDGEPVSPIEFIRTAEQLNLIDQVDGWVRKTAMKRCVELGLDKKNFVLDLNFSPTQKIDDAFVTRLLQLLEETQFPKNKLNLEITESAKMVFDNVNLKGLNRLKEHGIILSLDDFGTGYSSFSNLIAITAKALKTEKMFLDGIENDSYRQYLLSMLVDIAHYLDMYIVAEGVENQEQLTLLKKYGVDYAQGYLFSRPLTSEQLEKEAWRFW